MMTQLQTPTTNNQKKSRFRYYPKRSTELGVSSKQKGYALSDYKKSAQPEAKPYILNKEVVNYFKTNRAGFEQLMKDLKIKNTIVNRRLLLGVLSINSLGTEGFNLSILKLAKTGQTYPAKAFRFLAKLQKLGFLKCIDKTYIPGKKAKTFVARGLLRKTLAFVSKICKRLEQLFFGFQTASELKAYFQAKVKENYPAWFSRSRKPEKKASQYKFKPKPKVKDCSHIKCPITRAYLEAMKRGTN